MSKERESDLSEDDVNDEREEVNILSIRGGILQFSGSVGSTGHRIGGAVVGIGGLTTPGLFYGELELSSGRVNFNAASDVPGASLSFGADSTVNFNDELIGSFTYSGGLMTLGSDYTGTISVSKANGKITLNDGVNIIAGGVDNTSGTPDSAGLTLKGSSKIDGAIGSMQSLSNVSVFNKVGGSAADFGGAFNSKTLTLGPNSGHATFYGSVHISDEVQFTAPGQSLIFKANTTLAGGVNFTGYDNIIITDATSGNISLTGNIINTINNTGTLSIIGAKTATIASQVGSEACALKEIIIAHYTNAIFEDSVYTSNLTVGSGNVTFAGDVKIAGKLIVAGFVDFRGNVDLNGAEIDISAGGDIKFDTSVDITGCRLVGDSSHIHFSDNLSWERYQSQVQLLGFVDSAE